MTNSSKPLSKSNTTHGGGSRSFLQADIPKISANTSASFVQADSVQIFSAILGTLPLQMYRSLY